MRLHTCLIELLQLKGASQGTISRIIVAGKKIILPTLQKY